MLASTAGDVLDYALAAFFVATGLGLGYMLVLSGAGAVLAWLLVFSAAPFYPAYAGTGPGLFGISPLRDQQLAGIVMVAEQLATLGACSYFLLRARVRIDSRRAEHPAFAPVLGGRP